MQQKKNFHRHFATPGLNLYWIIIAYIIVGWFYPVVGLIALICMIGPVMTSIWKGRWWCGHVCPRAICTTVCCRNIHPTSQYRHLCVRSVSACSWCSLSSACSASNSHSPFPGARADWLCGVASVACFGLLS